MSNYGKYTFLFIYIYKFYAKKKHFKINTSKNAQYYKKRVKL